MTSNINFYPCEFFDEFPLLQLKTIYAMFRHGQYSAKFADRELEIYYHWIKEKDEEVVRVYSEIKGILASYMDNDTGDGMYSLNH
ncbi:MAG: hypothetical protein GX297_03395 [Treponema sp.]|jgi:hypothetical protein|nr:hypothetical protein [Treponema sp.]